MPRQSRENVDAHPPAALRHEEPVMRFRVAKWVAAGAVAAPVGLLCSVCLLAIGVHMGITLVGAESPGEKLVSGLLAVAFGGAVMGGVLGSVGRR